MHTHIASQEDVSEPGTCTSTRQVPAMCPAFHSCPSTCSWLSGCAAPRQANNSGRCAPLPSLPPSLPHLTVTLPLHWPGSPRTAAASEGGSEGPDEGLTGGQTGRHTPGRSPEGGRASRRSAQGNSVNDDRPAGNQAQPITALARHAVTKWVAEGQYSSEDNNCSIFP
jgi:hypothetical protein